LAFPENESKRQARHDCENQQRNSGPSVNDDEAAPILDNTPGHVPAHVYPGEAPRKGTERGDRNTLRLSSVAGVHHLHPQPVAIPLGHFRERLQLLGPHKARDGRNQRVQHVVFTRDSTRVSPCDFSDDFFCRPKDCLQHLKTLDPTFWLVF
jgi:hypothetical protein